MDVLDGGCTTQSVIHPKTVVGMTCSGIEQSAADFAQYSAKPYMYLDQAISSTLGQNHQTWSHCNHPKLMDQKWVEQTWEVAQEQVLGLAQGQTWEVAQEQVLGLAQGQTWEQVFGLAQGQTQEQVLGLAQGQTQKVALERAIELEDELKMRMNAKLV
jgi:hypothetical protein